MNSKLQYQRERFVTMLRWLLFVQIAGLSTLSHIGHGIYRYGLSILLGIGIAATLDRIIFEVHDNAITRGIGLGQDGWMIIPRSKHGDLS